MLTMVSKSTCKVQFKKSSANGKEDLQPLRHEEWLFKMATKSINFSNITI